MNIRPIKTRPLVPPQDNVLEVIDALDLQLGENSVIAITAKVVAIHQGRCVLIPENEHEALAQKDALIVEDAEWYLERDMTVPFPRIFTIYEGTLCSACGIDASNANGYWARLPIESSRFAKDLRLELCKKYGIQNLGIIITDSRSYPMRNGTIGVTIGYAGFEAEFDYRDTEDLFGQRFKSERINVADCLASTAIMAMGEGAESTPIAVIKDIKHIIFTDVPEQSDPMLSLKVPMEQDVYTQFYSSKDWKRGGSV